MGLRHFLLTIPLGSLLITIIVMYLLPWLKMDVKWYELYLIVIAVNVAVTLLAYLIIPPIKLRRCK